MTSSPMAWGAASHAIRPEPAALPDTSPALPTIFQSLGQALVKLVPGDANSPRLLTDESHAFMQTILQQLYDWGLENYAQVGSLNSLADTRLGKTLKQTLRSMHDDVEFLIMQGERSGEAEAASVVVPAAKRQAFQSYMAILKNFTPTIFRTLVKGGLVTEEGEIVREGEGESGAGSGSGSGSGSAAAAAADGGEGEGSERHVVRGEDGEEREVVFAEEDEEVDEEMGEADEAAEAALSDEEEDDDDDDDDDDDEEMEEGGIKE